MVSGVYRVTHLSTGRTLYVGSSQRVEKRYREHRGALEHGRHFNPHLQAAWNKYGPSDFAFDLIEACPVPALVARENHWMGALRPICNVALAADSPWRGRTMPAATREKIRAAMLGRAFSPEWRERIAAAKRGKKRPPMTPEWRAKIGAAHRGRRRPPRSPEMRARMSAAGRARTDGFMRGYKHTAEARQNMSAAHKGRPWSPARRAALERGRAGSPLPHPRTAPGTGFPEEARCS